MSIRGAKGVLINITGSADLALHEVNEAATLIQEEAHEDANIIFGAVIDESMGDEIRITVIATGFGACRCRRVRSHRAVKQAAARRPRRPPLPSPQRPPAAGRCSPPPRRASARSRSAASATPNRPVRRMGVVVDEGGEPKFKAHADDPSVPDRPETEFHIAEDEETTDYESPAFLRYQAK